MSIQEITDPWFAFTDEETGEQHVFIVRQKPDFPLNVYDLRRVDCETCTKFYLMGVFRYDEHGMCKVSPDGVRVYRS
jgi:hypothetical protein